MLTYRWNILMILGCSQAIAYIDRVNFAVVAPELVQNEQYSTTQVGFLLSIFNWAFTASLLMAGPFTDWVRPRVSFPLGVGLWSMATALCSITTQFAPLATLRALVGVGESTMIPSGSRVIRETYDQKNRAVAVAVFFAGNKIGLTLGTPLAAILLVNWGWSAVFFVTGSLGLIWIAWWLLSYRAPRHDTETDPAALEVRQKIRWLTLLRYRTTWGIIIGQGGYLYIYYVFALWLPGYLVLQRGMSTLNTGFVAMLPFLAGTICVILGGWVGDRLLKMGWRVTLARKMLAVGGLLAATVFTILGAYAVGTVTAVVFLTLAVASFSFSTAAVNSIPLDVAPPHIVSSLVSLQNFGGNLGGSFAPFVTGLLISESGDFTLPLLVAAGVALIAGCGSYAFVVGDLDRHFQPPGQVQAANAGEVPSGAVADR